MLLFVAAPAWAAGDPSSQPSHAQPPAARQTDLAKPPQPRAAPLGSLDTPAVPRDPFAPSDEEELPPVGRDNLFNEMQIRFCHAQLARINAVRPLLDRYQAEHVKYFNAQVADLNSRCGNYRYLGSALGDARAWLETNRARIEQDARNAYAQRFAGEAVVRGLDEGRPAMPPRPAPVEPSTASTPPRDQVGAAAVRSEAKPTTAAVSPASATRIEEGRVSAAQRSEPALRSDTPAREPERAAASPQAAAAAAPAPATMPATPPRVQPPAAQATAAARLPPATSYGAAQPPAAQAAAAPKPVPTPAGAAQPPAPAAAAVPAPATPSSPAPSPARTAAAAAPSAATPPATAQPPAQPTAAAGQVSPATPAATAQPPAQAIAAAGPAPATPPAVAQPSGQTAAAPAPPPSPATPLPLPTQAAAQSPTQTAAQSPTQTAALPPSAPPAAASSQPRERPATGTETALERLTQDIQRSSAQVLDQPPGASDKDADLTTQIELRYAAGGYIKSIVVGESSGSELLDRQALDLARALRYPAVPEALHARDFAVRFPIVFRARR